MDLCGHATLASAHVLWETGRLPPGETAIFHTRSGRLSARKLDEWIELDFPTRPPAECPAPPQLVQGLGVEPAWVGTSGDNYLAEFESERVVRALDPDFGLLKRLRAGVIVTSRSDDPAFDFVSRYFAPSYGIDEDPATGSAHCTLGPHWADRLGRNALVGHQVSSRGGVVRVRVDGERTYLGGQAVTVMRAELCPAVAGRATLCPAGGML